MSDHIKAIAKAMCHYSHGPSSFNSCCQHVNQCEAKAVEILAALAAAGFAVVPRVATEAMCRAGSHIYGEYAAQVWTAMVEAAGKELSSIA